MVDLTEQIPVKGEVWTHTKSGERYVILGASFNAITDRVEVAYAPLYDCDYTRFTRQTLGHEKAWVSKNDDGQPRFTRLCGGALSSLIVHLSDADMYWYRQRAGGL